MRHFWLSLCLLGLEACSSSAPPEYYTLSSASGAPVESTAAVVKVRRPVIPQTLDRPEMIRRTDDVRIHESSSHLWSEPLDTMIERILAEDLRPRIPRATVITESSEVAVKAAYIVDIDIQQFGTDADGHAVFQAQAVIRTLDGKVSAQPVLLTGASVTSYASMAKTLSALLGQFSDRLAVALHP